MGLKTPRPESDEPTSLIFKDVWLNFPDGNPLPNPADCTIDLEPLTPNIWGGRTGWDWEDRYASVTLDGTEWQISMFIVGLVVLAFSGVGENLHEIFNNLLGSGDMYSGGTCEVVCGESDVNQAAEDAGMPLGDKVFYEPMSEAVGHKSYRFAHQPDGSRIYIRKEL